MSGDVFSGDMMKQIVPALVTTVVGSMFKAKEPKEKKLPTAPTPNEHERQARKERELQRKYTHSGRAGTVLNSSTLG